jgi:superfamily II DNA helicase RecQ
MIRDTFSSAKPGTIVLSLAPLLSLSKDQVTKLEIKAKTPHLVSMAFTIDKGINTDI